MTKPSTPRRKVICHYICHYRSGLLGSRETKGKRIDNLKDAQNRDDKPIPTNSISWLFLLLRLPNPFVGRSSRLGGTKLFQRLAFHIPLPIAVYLSRNSDTGRESLGRGNFERSSAISTRPRARTRFINLLDRPDQPSFAEGFRAAGWSLRQLRYRHRPSGSTIAQGGGPRRQVGRPDLDLTGWPTPRVDSHAPDI